jgi:ketosteroid isomerase-like protein
MHRPNETAEEATAGRTIAERAGLRWPGILPRATQSVLRLPPGSRVRRAMLRRIAQMAFEAWNRGDFELVPYVDNPDVETRVMQGAGPPIGLDAVYYGPEGHCRSMEVWNEAWREWNAQIEEIVEEGRDRVLIIARVHVVGSASGVELDEWGAVRYTFREGRIARVDGAFDTDRERVVEALAASRDEALEAAERNA